MRMFGFSCLLIRVRIVIFFLMVDGWFRRVGFMLIVWIVIILFLLL